MSKKQKISRKKSANKWKKNVAGRISASAKRRLAEDLAEDRTVSTVYNTGDFARLAQDGALLKTFLPEIVGPGAPELSECKIETHVVHPDTCGIDEDPPQNEHEYIIDDFVDFRRKLFSLLAGDEFDGCKTLGDSAEHTAITLYQEYLKDKRR